MQNCCMRKFSLILPLLPLFQFIFLLLHFLCSFHSISSYPLRFFFHSPFIFVTTFESKQQRNLSATAYGYIFMPITHFVLALNTNIREKCFLFLSPPIRCGVIAVVWYELFNPMFGCSNVYLADMTDTIRESLHHFHIATVFCFICETWALIKHILNVEYFMMMMMLMMLILQSKIE